MDAVLGLAILVVWLGSMVMAGLKGKYFCMVLGILGSIWAVVAAIRLAKPNSWWASHVYAKRAPWKVDWARQRFKKQAAKMDSAAPVVAAPESGIHA